MTELSSVFVSGLMLHVSERCRYLLVVHLLLYENEVLPHHTVHIFTPPI